MTDARQATFALPATSTVAGAAGARFTPILLIRCSQGDVDEGYLEVGRLVTSELGVELRFDSGPVAAEAWSASTDRQALFSPDAYALVDSILTHRKLTVRYAPPLENPQVGRFTLASLRPLDSALKKYCGFTVSERLAVIEGRTPAPVARVELDSAMVVLRLAQPGTFDGRQLIARVVGMNGVTVTEYQAEFELSRGLDAPVRRTVDPNLRFTKGVTYVRVIVNGTPATQMVRVEVQ